MDPLLRIALFAVLLALPFAGMAQAHNISAGFCIAGICQGTPPQPWPVPPPEKPGCTNVVGRGGVVEPPAGTPGDPVVQVCL